MKVVYSPHAELKFKILEGYGVIITKSQVEGTVLRPDRVTKGRKGRLIAQKITDEKHLLRVIYEEKRYEGEI